jgi:hypothetical protein
MTHSLNVLADLPASFVADVKSHLGAYSNAYITRKDNGYYSYTSSICLHNEAYETMIGEVLSHEVLTTNERIISYVKNFRSFPYRVGNGEARYTYSGIKNYRALQGDWTDVDLDADGNLRFK